MNESELFTAKTVRRVCGVSDRQLIHWISRDVVRPAKCYRKSHSPKRVTYLFDFASLVQVSVAQHLRGTGVPLGKIEIAARKLRARGRDRWEKEWLLVTATGNIVWVNEGNLETLSGKHSGQFVFSVIALPALHEAVSLKLAKEKPFEKADSGTIVSYSECLR